MHINLSWLLFTSDLTNDCCDSYLRMAFSSSIILSHTYSMLMSAHLSDFKLDTLSEDEKSESDEFCESSSITTMEGLPLILIIGCLMLELKLRFISFLNLPEY